MRLFYFNIWFIMIFEISCSTAQKTINESSVKISYDGNPKGTSTRIAIYFTGGFNDSLLIKQNNYLIKKDFFKSDWSTGFTGVVETVDLKNGDIVEVTELNTGKKILIKLVKGFKILELSKYSDEWAALYTNRAAVFE